MAVQVDGVMVGGLQERAVHVVNDGIKVSLTYVAQSRPNCQVSHPLFFVLPFMVFARVAVSL